ncbi:hypothetical protein [Flavobacterium mesophilum]|uniref:hypothetical protein n=1 Tax=Flavobacterium mesophilum TaxID=3143495 RepID=UPI0031D4EA2B
MSTEILLEDKKKEANYFKNFNFLKFKKILLPLAIIILLLVIKQFIINNFNITKSGGLGLAGILTPFVELPIWAKTINMIIDLLIMVAILCWEAVYEKKYDKIKIVLLLGLPSTVFFIIKAYSGFYDFVVSSPFPLALISILSYFPSYALYGAFRGKILYGKKISILGYLIGLIALINIDALYQKLVSIVLIDELGSSIYSYGTSIIMVFIPLSFFYFIFLLDAGFSFKNFTKMPPASFLTRNKFTLHFVILFTFLISLHLNFTENFSVSWFTNIDASILDVLGALNSFIHVIFQIVFVYLLFSQLLLLQLTALRRRPLWIYLFSFVPVINLFTLVFYFRKRTPLTNNEFLEIEYTDEQNRSYLQLFILILVSTYGIYKFIGLGLDRENLIYIISGFIVLYILILYFRIGVWIALALLGLATIFCLYRDLTTGLYYACVFSYGAMGLYNLHISIFWKAEEWDEIQETIIPENIQQA